MHEERVHCIEIFRPIRLAQDFVDTFLEISIESLEAVFKQQREQLAGTIRKLQLLEVDAFDLDVSVLTAPTSCFLHSLDHPPAQGRP